MIITTKCVVWNIKEKTNLLEITDINKLFVILVTEIHCILCIQWRRRVYNTTAMFVYSALFQNLNNYTGLALNIIGTFYLMCFGTGYSVLVCP